MHCRKIMSGGIIVAVDGSELSLQAVDAAIDLSSSVGASVEVIHVVDLTKAAMLSYGNPQYVAGCLAALRDEGADFLKIASAHAAEKAATVRTTILDGNPAEEIVGYAARRDAKWIVMGSHGRSGLSRFLVGSVAEGVLRHSSVPVLIVPMQRKAHHSSAA